jgi:hypothetical protein
MKENPLSETEQSIETQELSVEHASMLVFLSFRFSQGSVALQEKILTWIHYQYPNYKLSADNNVLVNKKVIEMSKNFIFKGPDRHTKQAEKNVPLTDSLVEDQADSFTSLFFRKLQGTRLATSAEREDNMSFIVQLMASRDLKFLTQNSRTPFLVNYGVNQKTTGVAEYDRMFQQIREFIKKEREKGSASPIRRTFPMLEEIGYE